MRTSRGTKVRHPLPSKRSAACLPPAARNLERSEHRGTQLRIKPLYQLSQFFVKTQSVIMDRVFQCPPGRCNCVCNLMCITSLSDLFGKRFLCPIAFCNQRPQLLIFFNLPQKRGDKGVCFDLIPSISLSEIGEEEGKPGNTPGGPRQGRIPAPSSSHSSRWNSRTAKCVPTHPKEAGVSPA